ncbi:SIMPL domain-containing protein [Xanthomonas arboricola pv. juglandis]|uniref:SIMPL domain-containing protein n=1 Tax=Xanthomonas TaxID=338 RepID=UPI000E5A1154|nr:MULTISPECIES: SIMPL domain-containing protein [Xanthomonas]CAD1793368.1 SIMPL domain-containing protein [Xanthomonas sp. CPBF 426]CAG2092050.1 SIMPL domain-containing protein [Xanthomonas euroxanthea]SYZ52451.1 SIMPL domain-containing protein [Xanthomonas arboricola pv. juglandis]
MRTTLKPLLLALSIAAGTAMTAHAQTTPSYTIPNDGTLLNVSAEAEAKRIPDIATLSAGVVTQAADGNAAMRQNAEQMSKVMAAIKAAGIADKDVQTTGINLSPQYTYKENEAPRINGYQASNTVSLKVRDISRLGKVLDALVAQGANDINGPSFSVDQPEPAYDEARVAALKKAQARADTYAKSLGLKVRRIVSISEGRGGGLRPMMMAASMRSAKAEMDTQVAPGESTLSINLDVTFELGR